MPSHDTALPHPADDCNEAGVLATEIARAYKRMAAFYRDQLHLTGPDADARARGDDYTPEEAAEDLARIQERPPDQVSWYDLEHLANRDPGEVVALWQEIKTKARAELSSGHRAAKALDWDGRPWQRARYLAIRSSLQGDSPSASGVEAALVDMAAEAYSGWLEESEHAQMLSSGEVARERLELERDGGFSPPRLVMAEAIDQAAQRAERAHQRFLKTAKMLTDLRRSAQTLYVARAGQVNIGQQQVNLANQPSSRTNEEAGDLPK